MLIVDHERPRNPSEEVAPPMPENSVVVTKLPTRILMVSGILTGVVLIWLGSCFR